MAVPDWYPAPWSYFAWDATYLSAIVALLIFWRKYQVDRATSMLMDEAQGSPEWHRMKAFLARDNFVWQQGILVWILYVIIFEAYCVVKAPFVLTILGFEHVFGEDRPGRRYAVDLDQNIRQRLPEWSTIRAWLLATWNALGRFLDLIFSALSRWLLTIVTPGRRENDTEMGAPEDPALTSATDAVVGHVRQRTRTDDN